MSAARQGRAHERARSRTATAAASRTQRQAEVLAALQPLLPAHALLWRSEDTVPYECDGLTAYREQPLLVALPETEAQVAAVLRACHALKVPVVARGAGTGLSGGALPHRLGVTLSLAKFNKILKLDKLRAHRHRAMRRAQPGHQRGRRAAGPVLRARPEQPDRLHHRRQRGRKLRRRALPEVRPDPAQRAARARLHHRRRGGGVRLRGAGRAGLDLLALVVGSEGMLAVTTEVTVKLVPKPQLARCIMASFDDIRKAGDAVAQIIAAGIIPAGLEMMDKPMTAAVEDFVHAGYDLDAEAILLCESDGTPEEVDEEIGRMLDVLTGGGATRMEVSKDEAQRLKFWSGRKNAFPASGRISPDYMCMDSTIPRKRLADMLLAIQAMEQKYGLRCANVFHAGDGNLHPLILFDANDPDQLHRCELFGADILETSVAMGGTVTGEHGVGIEKLSSMCVQFSPEEREQMFAVKRAFDPGELLNPGKVIPLLSRCAEYGKMHVKKGLLPFPELPRF